MSAVHTDQQEQAACWLETRKLLQEQVDDWDFESWIGQIAFSQRVNGTVELAVPSRFHADTISNRYTRVIGEAIWKTFGEGVGFELVIDEQLATLPEEPDSSRNAARKQLYPARLNEVAPVAKRPFVAGEHSALVGAAVKEFLGTDGPLSHKRALCVFGDNGVGKTHFIETVLAWYRKCYPRAHVFVENAEQFKQAHLRSYDDNSGTLFFRRRAEADLWVVDDFHMIETKKEDAACHKQFLAIWKAIADRKHKILLVSKVSPSKVPVRFRDLACYLLGVNDFEMGMPGAQTKGEIIQSVVRESKLDTELVPPMEVLQYLVREICEVGELVSKTETLLFEIKTSRRKMDLSAVEQWLSRRSAKTKTEARTLSCASIIEAVEEQYGLKGQLTKRGRSQRLVGPRQVAAYLIKKLLPAMSNDATAKELGLTNGSTIHHSVEQVSLMLSGERSASEAVLLGGTAPLQETLEKIAKKLGCTLK